MRRLVPTRLPPVPQVPTFARRARGFGICPSALRRCGTDVREATRCGR